jgi:hypothetical protein
MARFANLPGTHEFRKGWQPFVTLCKNAVILIVTLKIIE